MEYKELSRRKFLTNIALTTGGVALLTDKVFGMPAYIKHLDKPNSVFNGVQVGAISYSWRSMPCGVEDVLKYCQECNISAIELLGCYRRTLCRSAGVAFLSARRTQRRPKARAGCLLR